MKVKQKGQASAKENVLEIDLGEKIDSAIRSEAARMAGSSKKGGSKLSRFAGGYRPGMYGGYRPWYAQRGLSGDWKLGSALGLPQELKRVGSGLLTGTIAASAGNRVVVWGIANLAGVRSRLLGEAIGFGVGLVPLLAKRNAMTFGIAIPGTVQLVGALAQEIMEFTGISFLRNPGLGATVRRQQMGSQQAANEARGRLAEVQRRIQAARRGAQGMQGIPTVMARPRVPA